MRIITLVRSEFARLVSSRMGLLALVALMTVPIAYGGLYLYGNADPYNQLDKVPAAIVVDDTGTYGPDAAEQLVKDQRFGWVIVSDAAAQQGVTDGTYDFSLTFPADFSNDLDSSGDASPTQASLVLTTNDTNSYLSTTLAKQAASAVQAVIAQQVGEHAARTLLDAVDSIRTGLVDASDGASQLADATATAATGAQSLATGSSTLASGAQSLSAGLSELDSQAAALPGSASTLAGGAASVASGASGAAALTPGIRAQLAGVFAASNVSPADQATILGELDTLSGSLGQLSGGASQVSAGASALSASAPTLAAAIHSAATGAASLSDGAASASSGAAQLRDGLTQLSSGASELDDSLASGVDKVPATTVASRATAASAIADPVAVDQHAITEAQNYGAGLAPFFISLAAWIGIYALFLLVRPLSRRALTAVRRPISTALAGWATPAVLGAVQMIGLFAIVVGVLGLQPANPVGLLAFMILVSMTFAAIVLALNVWLGSIGQFLGLLLMIVQLVTAGGTFPWQTLPAPLAFLHQALPMSHAVEGVRQLMYGGTDLWSAVLPLLVWLVLALGITVLGARKQGRFRTLRELRPSPLAG